MRVSHFPCAAMFALFVISCAADEAPSAVLDGFTAASVQSDLQLRGASMNTDIVATVPKLEKSASVRGIRKVSRAGAVSFEQLTLSGDSSVRQQIIARYLAAEENRGNEHDLRSLALTTANYRFQFKASEDVDGRRAYVFRVKPRHKKEGSFDGVIWIDAQTYLPLRESGRVLQHSIFLRRLTMVRKFTIVDRFAVPESTDIAIDTRLVGKALMTVKIRNITFAPQQAGNVNLFPAVQ